MDDSSNTTTASTGEQPLPSLRVLATSYPARLAVYSITAILLCQLVFVMIQERGLAYAARENGPVEVGQVLMAVSTAILFAIAACCFEKKSAALAISACLVGYAAARESDDWFETVFFDDAYKYFVGVPLAAIVLWIVWKHPRRIVSELLDPSRFPMLTLFVVAGVHICGLCQIFDRPDLWSGLGVDAEHTKAAVEEFAEFFGYLILTFSSVESLTDAIHRSSFSFSLTRCKSSRSSFESESIPVRPTCSRT